MAYDYYIGIDAGQPLFMGALDGNGRLLRVTEHDEVATAIIAKTKSKNKKWTNQPELIMSWLTMLPEQRTHVVIEDVNPMPSQGVVSSCRFVGSKYMAHGIVAAMGFSYTLVTPRVWKSAMGLKGAKQDLKEISRTTAIRRWPDHAELFKRKMDHNRAEALLLAEYGRTQL